jgi:hypothetical protein
VEDVPVKVKSLLGLCVLAAMVTACGDDDNKTPTTPTTPNNGGSAAATLTAPGADFPSEDQQLNDLRPTLRVLNATSTPTGTRTYEFQISDTSDFSASSAASFAGHFKVVKTQANVAEGGSGKTEFPVPDDLQPTTRFYWRARARQGTTDGPWSPTASFRTKVMGYNISGELYDPLTAGETIGSPVGNLTFTPGRGVTINSNDSHVRYNLVSTITSGEFSVEVEGIQNNSPGDKTKIMAMYNGQGDITTSDWRCTVEKRDGGIIAWRFIAGEPEEQQIDTVGGERVPVNFNPGQTYLWKATWGGGFRLQILEGGAGGPTIYDFGKGLGATYAPNPHVAYLGSPLGRAGANDASVVGATFRNTFIGQNRPRPSSLGSALLPKKRID